MTRTSSAVLGGCEHGLTVFCRLAEPDYLVSFPLLSVLFGEGISIGAYIPPLRRVDVSS